MMALGVTRSRSRLPPLRGGLGWGVCAEREADGGPSMSLPLRGITRPPLPGEGATHVTSRDLLRTAPPAPA